MNCKFIYKRAQVILLMLCLIFVIRRFTSSWVKVANVNKATKYPIIVASVACSKDNKNFFYEETVVMLKSILISSGVYNLERPIEFHIFLENPRREIYFRERLEEFTRGNQKFHFHSIKNIVPEKDVKHMIYHRRFRCAFVRAFFPSILRSVDSLIYFDSDIIVTGDVSKVWNLLETMTENEMIAIGRNNEPNDVNFNEMDKRLFGDIPHVPPKGVNNGVILMNLTRLRRFNWEKTFLDFYEEYSKSVKELTVQRLMNILLFFYPEILRIIPCDMHFIHTHCTKGPTCLSLVKESTGIQVIHGANHTLERNKIFHEIYFRYKKFNASGNFLSDIALPVRRFYENQPMNASSQCYTELTKHLFKNFI